MTSLLDRQLNVGHAVYERYAGSLFEHGKTPPLAFGAGSAPLMLYEIEGLVLFAVSDEIPFVPMVGRHADGTLHSTFNCSGKTERYFGRLPEYVKIAQALSTKYDFNECITVFIQCCNDIGMHLGRHIVLDLRIPAKIETRSDCITVTAEIFNELVSRIKNEWHRQGLGEKYRSRCRQAQKRYKEYSNYESTLFESNAKLVILRVDFFYKPELRDQIDDKTAIADLNHFIENKRHNSIFKVLKGYIIKLEYRFDKGLFWHSIFFIDDSVDDAKEIVELSKNIGEYWSKAITQQRGLYLIPNNYSKYSEDLEVFAPRVIDAADIKARNKIRTAIACLCKADQCLRLKDSVGIKLIRKGLEQKYSKVRKK